MGSKKLENCNGEWNMTQIKCPDCGAKTKAYHQSNGDGTTTTRVVCGKKCNEWKVIKESTHGFSKITKKRHNGE